MIHRAEEADYVPMLDHSTFGLPSGAGIVNQIHQIRSGRTTAESLMALTRNGRPFTVDT